MEPVFCLCYIRGCWAYFTTRALDKQWGDDWNDAPYEHNAGSPYRCRGSEFVDGQPAWLICKVAFESELETPEDAAGCNSEYSVENINKKKVPWLQHSRFTDTQDRQKIWAGATLDEFTKTIKALGGEVFAPTEAGDMDRDVLVALREVAIQFRQIINDYDMSEVVPRDALVRTAGVLGDLLFAIRDALAEPEK